MSKFIKIHLLQYTYNLIFQAMSTLLYNAYLLEIQSKRFFSVKYHIKS